MRYSKVEKLVYALVTITKCLRSYFQAHTIVVFTDQSLKAQILAKWIVQLGGFDISYQPHLTMKAQFIAGCTWTDDEASQKEINEKNRPRSY